MSVYFDIKSLYPHFKVNWNVLMCKICFARHLVVNIFLWCNANFVPFPIGTLVARRKGNGRILHKIVFVWRRSDVQLMLIFSFFVFYFTNIWIILMRKIGKLYSWILISANILWINLHTIFTDFGSESLPMCSYGLKHWHLTHLAYLHN